MRALFALSALAAAPAAAQTIAPLAEARLRHEHVHQAGLPEQADAVTARIRAGLVASAGRWSALAEAQGNLAIAGQHFDGLAGPATRHPLIADPQNVALYRAQLQYRAPGATITAGRQRIMLDDERFVGNAAFRNNAQTFDALRAELVPAGGLKADLTYAWNVRTIWGIDGIGARPGAIGGDNLFVNLGWASPIGTLTGFAYLVDQDAAAVQGYRLSSQSYGLRLAGARSLGRARIAYQASWARQSDWHRNPNDYRADYRLADVAVDLNGPRIGGGYEVLGADRGTAHTSFQTPLSSVFKFQGWADRFITTPPDGIRDGYVSLGWGWQQVGRFKGVSLGASYHRFASDRLVRHYGDEFDVLAQARLGRTTASLRYAAYDAARLLTDTDKLWLQLDWTI